MERMLVGSTIRYIAGRNAMQTVYWRKTKDVQQSGFLKYNKTCSFGKQQEPIPDGMSKYSDERTRIHL